MHDSDADGAGGLVVCSSCSNARTAWPHCVVDYLWHVCT